MKKIAAIFLCLSLVCGFFAIGAQATNDNTTATVNAGCSGIDASTPFLGAEEVVKNGTAAILYELNSDTLMHAMNPDAQVFPASFVKIMTAMIAIEEGNLEDMVTADRETLNSVDYTAVSADIQDGEIMTLRDLLYCMMVGSANDAAAVIARHIGSSQAEFVTMMNARAAELGCTSTNFTNAHGLHNANQFTTARDMVRIIREAAKNVVFAEIFGAVKYTVPATNKSAERNLVTGNYLMSDSHEQIYYDARVTGGRTGVADDNTRCVAATAQSGSMRLLAIVFGAKSQYAADRTTIEVFGGFREITKLLDVGFDKYQVSQVLYDNQALVQRPVINGENALILAPKEAKLAVLPRDFVLSEVEYRISEPAQAFIAPIAQGTVQSRVEVWYRNFCIAATDLIAFNSVAEQSLKTAVPYEKDGTDLQPLGVIFLLVAISPVIALLTIRTVNIVRRKKRFAKTASGNRRK